MTGTATDIVPVVGSPPTPKPTLHCCHCRGHCRGDNNPGMIIIILASNNNDAPDATVDNDAVAIGTVALTMSRNALFPSSTWTAVQRTSLADANPSSLSWPSLCIFPPQGGLPHCGRPPPLSPLLSSLLLHCIAIRFDHHPVSATADAYCFP
jgi:hypothetical protein